ncbi:glycosyltransferase family 4 protein [Alcaligenaceae bacterium LF4-65]|uniref:Glycosyltransferase family 4 protein n=1 Tax=Zwartia hollandica TaxID=324606 RepID=A0A953N8P5_9BURK|nr:glycosyltransferase family 1 protein [Zwartia hollandica]MBZ1350068.1 glycosyltransferase family 4 protein [Zwartia hollandica]
MMHVGFGVTALCKGLAGGSQDGISHYTQELITQFAKRAELNLQPFSFAVGAQDIKELDRKVFETASPQHLPHSVLHLGKYPTGALYSAFTGADFPDINKLGKVDLIHATDHYIPRAKFAPMVATLMDAIPFSHPEWSSGRFRGAKNALWKKAISWADHIITISEHSKQELCMWTGVAAERISVIPLGVDARWFREVTAEEFALVRAKFKLPSQYFISVGTLQPRKNVGGVIAAHRAMSLAQRKQTPLVIVGRAGWKCEEEIKQIEADAQTGTIVWLQQVSDAELLPILKAARALLFPSLAEGFGLPVLEGFAAQVPVITSTTTSLPEVAGTAALAVEPTDVDALSEAMRRVLDDHALHASLQQHGLARAQRFTWESCAEATLATYQRLTTG